MKMIIALLLSIAFVAAGCGDDDTTPPDANMRDSGGRTDSGRVDAPVTPDAQMMMIDLMGYDIRVDDASTYARVDRVGVPAISTALAGTASDLYNDGNPTDDAMLTYATTLITNLGALHMALDDDLTAAGVAPCSMIPPAPGGLPPCVTQELIAGSGLTTAFVVVPDFLNVGPMGMLPGFPNSRRLTNPVIDVILAMILLDLTSTDGCDGGPCTLTSLVGTNPVANDVPFRGQTDPMVASTEFPYLADPHVP